MKVALALGFVLLAVVATWTLGPARARAPGELTVVELFQSQGCSSCPPANANVAAIADRPDVLALSFAVTYWDQLGWRDTFAKPQFTARQYDYARGLHHSNVYTPQVVVNGRQDLTGVDRGQLDAAIAGTAGVASRLLVLVNGTVAIREAPPRAPADIWLVRYDRRTLLVPIVAGENDGRTLPHRNIVRELVRIGSWNGAAETFRLPPPADANFATAILVQAPNGGPILAAAKADR